MKNQSFQIFQISKDHISARRQEKCIGTVPTDATRETGGAGATSKVDAVPVYRDEQNRPP